MINLSRIHYPKVDFKLSRMYEAKCHRYRKYIRFMMLGSLDLIRAKEQLGQFLDKFPSWKQGKTLILDEAFKEDDFSYTAKMEDGKEYKLRARTFYLCPDSGTIMVKYSLLGAPNHYLVRGKGDRGYIDLLADFKDALEVFYFIKAEKYLEKIGTSAKGEKEPIKEAKNLFEWIKRFINCYEAGAPSILSLKSLNDLFAQDYNSRI